jgi:hypothetical protein
MHVDRFESGAIKRGSHFDLTVDALFAENSDARSVFGGSASKLAVYVKRQLRGDTGVGRIEAELVFLFGGLGVVAEALDVARDVGPVVAQIEEIFFDDEFSALSDAKGVGVVERADDPLPSRCNS